MHRAAIISPCGAYRYWLSRTWADGPVLPFVMLNPSTANHEEDDQTIRTCVALAKREGYGGLFVVNLFAWRATNPKDMKAQADPFGPEGIAWWMFALEHDSVVAAWGAHGGHMGASALFRDFARAWGCGLRTIGLTAGGEPRHPLYMRADAPLVTLSA